MGQKIDHEHGRKERAKSIKKIVRKKKEKTRE